MTIHHTGIKVPSDKFDATKKWYEAALAPLGYKVAMTFLDGAVVGFGDQPHGADWWISSDDKAASTSHHAFAAKDRAAVDAFHAAAVAAGGKDNGPPGPRPQYSPAYYAAFMFDPAGNNIEVVTFAPAV
ncbi:putative glyoxalase [Thozetella sp. PMI_491]|nr:putative glyoxalase [Thozetella sp. PMI_491]